jgi:hypothetical protein
MFHHANKYKPNSGISLVILALPAKYKPSLSVLLLMSSLHEIMNINV